MISLLRAIERHHHKFKSPPIGPIGSHVVSGRKLDDCIWVCLYCVVLKRYSLCYILCLNISLLVVVVVGDIPHVLISGFFFLKIFCYSPISCQSGKISPLKLLLLLYTADLGQWGYMGSCCRASDWEAA